MDMPEPGATEQDWAEWSFLSAEALIRIHDGRLVLLPGVEATAASEPPKLADEGSTPSSPAFTLRMSDEQIADIRRDIEAEPCERFLKSLTKKVSSVP